MRNRERKMIETEESDERVRVGEREESRKWKRKEKIDERRENVYMSERCLSETRDVGSFRQNHA